jgi:F-type H+-transporting ATPase subunit epsilon
MADKQLIVTVISPEETLYGGAAQAVFLPGASGRFEVLPGHAPLISTLEAGEIVVRDTEGVEHHIAVRGGVVRVSGDKVTACVEADRTGGEE